MFGSAFRTVALACAALLAASMDAAQAAAPGNIGACYSPFHNQAYPLHGEKLASVDGVRKAIEDDFKKLSQHFTHIRTYYSQYVGIDVAPIAAANNIKLYLGVLLTNEAWGQNEVDAAVRAVKQHPETVEAIFVGSENLINFQATADTILNKVNQIKAALGPELAGKVKFGTAQRVNEYLDEKYNGETAKLAAGLDILGVNIYPFFTNSYNPADPEALLDAMWNNVAAKFPASKLRVTETGYPTAGSNPSMAPNVKPSLDNSVGYYEGLLNWAPKGAEGSPKFWFQAYDLRGDDKSMGVDYETHFGFFTADGQNKKANFPYTKEGKDVPEPKTPAATTAAPVAPAATTPAATTPAAPVAPIAPAPANNTPVVTPAATPAPANKGISFEDIGKDDDLAPGKIGKVDTPKQQTPATAAPAPVTASPATATTAPAKKKAKKDCHA